MLNCVIRMRVSFSGAATEYVIFLCYALCKFTKTPQQSPCMMKFNLVICVRVYFYSKSEYACILLSPQCAWSGACCGPLTSQSDRQHVSATDVLLVDLCGESSLTLGATNVWSQKS